MANEEHLAILKKGVDTWNRWREENPGTCPDLALADLWWADLHGADLRGVNLLDFCSEDNLLLGILSQKASSCRATETNCINGIVG